MGLKKQENKKKINIEEHNNMELSLPWLRIIETKIDKPNKPSQTEKKLKNKQQKINYN